MELDFTVLNRIKPTQEPTRSDTQTPEKNRSGEYKDTTRREILLQARKTAEATDLEKAELERMMVNTGLNDYPPEDRRATEAYLIMAILADMAPKLTAEEMLAQALRALSVTLETDCIKMLIEEL